MDYKYDTSWEDEIANALPSTHEDTDPWLFDEPITTVEHPLNSQEQSSHGLRDRLHRKRSANEVQPDVETITEKRLGAGVYKYGKSVAYSTAGLASLGKVEWLVDRIIPKQVIAVLYAKTGHYKSFFALDLAFSLACGRDFMGHQVRQSPIVYYYLEDPQTLEERWRAWQRDRQIGELDNIRFWTERVSLFDNDDSGSTEVIRRLEAMAELPGLVIFDTVSEMFAGEANENETADMQIFMGALKKIRTATGASVLVVHHEGPRAQPRGSKVLLNDANAVIRIKTEKQWGLSKEEIEENPLFVVSNEKQRSGVRFPSFWLRRRIINVDDNISAPVLDHFTEKPVIEKKPKPTINGVTLNARQQMAWDEIQKQPGIGDAALMEKMNVKAVRTVRGYAKALKEAGLVLVDTKTKQGGGEEFYWPKENSSEVGNSALPTSPAAVSRTAS